MIQHVFLRGVNREPILRDDLDNARLATRLARVLRETDVLCLAWAFMVNHIHLLLLSGATTSVSKFMHRVFSPYARSFNLRHARSGPTLERRFGNVPVLSDHQLLNVVRYVLLNPVEAGIVSLADLPSFAWTSAPALFRGKHDAITAVDRTLALFGQNEDASRGSLHQWLLDGLSDERGLRDVEEMVARAPMTVFDVSPRRERSDLRIVLFDLKRAVCDAEGITLRALESGSRQAEIVRVRRSYVVEAVRRVGPPLRLLAEELGVTESAVSQLARGALSPRILHDGASSKK